MKSIDIILLTALVGLRDHPERRNKREGLCNNVLSQVQECCAYWVAADARALCEAMSDKWPEKKGERSYPVPGGHLAYIKARYNGTMWEGEYGQKRLELLDWLIATLEKENGLELSVNPGPETDTD